jgi:DNA-binding MarR family transcriptional regulator
MGYPEKGRKSEELSLDSSRARTVDMFARAARDRTLEEHQLVECARSMMKARAEVAKLAPTGLFRDAAWDVMLELFVRVEEGGIVYVKQLAIASGQSTASAMRLLDRLESAGMLARVRDSLDQRRVIVTLAERGRELMKTMLRKIAVSRPRNDEAAAGAPVPFIPRESRLR